MSKLVKTYENRVEKIELTFRGEVFSYSMIEDEDGGGRTSDKKCLSIQIADRFPEFENDEGFESIIDELECSLSDDDLFDALEELEMLEEDYIR